MDAAVDAAQAGLIGGLAEAGEVAGHAQQGLGGGAEAGVVAEGGGQDAGGGGAEGRVAGHVAGVGRRDEQGRPIGVDHGGGIAVLVGVLNGGDGAPCVVGVLGVPTGDGRVGQSDVELGHQAGIGAERVALGGGHLGGDVGPMAGRGVAAAAIGPELGLLGLVGGAGAAGGTANALDLVELGGVLRGVERGRRGGAELVGAGEREGQHLAPLHVLRGEVERAAGAPLADGGAAVVGGEVEVAVGGADVDDGAGDAVAQGDAG